ncbi:16S rRNA (cytosine(967)-C(5))-methyltransferase RsmB [Paenibacillus thailandensis]|uniref:16S rRNA (cytosine(967)-C(5))-methyltransferase n=1 Tax=Paenibacillus thailandensis TaxID=393250 RepID=A0ABW5QX70_9BACL
MSDQRRTARPKPNNRSESGGSRKHSGGKASGASADRRRGGPKPRSARELALDTLLKVAETGAYSNLQLNRALQEAQLSKADAALVTELVYGTIQRQKTLDYWLAQFAAKGLGKLEPWVLQLLRLSLYQLLYLDRIPPHAAVNEAVAIAKRRGHQGISGMVNGMLRSIVRRRSELVPEAISGANEAERIATAHSYPEWLAKRWIDRYGEDAAERICASGNEPPHASLRVNRLKNDAAQVLAELQADGYEADRSPAAPQVGIVVRRGGNMADTAGYREGRWTVQDESSMLVAQVVAPKPGMQVLDCCAAPGGKSTHLAELMEGKGKVWANDIHPHKLQLIEAQVARLGLANVEAIIGDAAKLGERFAPESLDAVLLDAPCSGLGVIRRKPEIKWTKSPEDVEAIAEIQKRLLDAVAVLVKPGGTLVYSTCTIEPKENERQVERFLREHPEYGLDRDWPEDVLQPLREAGAVGPDFDGSVQLLPFHFQSDGFFIARLRKRP